MERNPSDRKIVESTLSMAHSLDLSVVAEGIETQAQANLLRELGCDLGQGFLFARPLEPDAFAAWYLERQPSRSAQWARSA